MKVSSSGSNSVGRVRPCQGRCRRFESGLPLQIFPPSRIVIMKPLLIFSSLIIAAAVAYAQDYKLETISTSAPGLPAAYAAVIETSGYRVIGPAGVWCEIWFRKSIPTGTRAADDSIVLPLGQGTLLGILRFAGSGYDRRGQTVKAGV